MRAEELGSFPALTAITVTFIFLRLGYRFVGSATNSNLRGQPDRTGGGTDSAT
jgi:hypothetical protein